MSYTPTIRRPEGNPKNDMSRYPTRLYPSSETRAAGPNRTRLIAELSGRVDELTEDNRQLRASIMLYQELIRRMSETNSDSGR